MCSEYNKDLGKMPSNPLSVQREGERGEEFLFPTKPHGDRNNPRSGTNNTDFVPGEGKGREGGNEGGEETQEERGEREREREREREGGRAGGSSPAADGCGGKAVGRGLCYLGQAVGGIHGYLGRADVAPPCVTRSPAGGAAASLAPPAERLPRRAAP